MTSNKLVIVYIAGVGRSGTTLLARMLGETAGFVNVGEAARYLFNDSMLQRDLPCGCGRSVRDCEFWQPMLPLVSDEVRSEASRLARLRYYPYLALASVRPGVRAAIRRVVAGMQPLYRALAERYPGHVIVDSAKHPSNGYLLAQFENAEVSIVHCVRDSRDVVGSWTTKKGYLKQHTVLGATAGWVGTNFLSEVLGRSALRYLRVRYEDLVRQPLDVLRSLLAEIGCADTQVRCIDGNHAVFGIQHMLAGNPAKFELGRVLLQMQVVKLGWKHHRLVTGLTYPLLRRYGYV